MWSREGRQCGRDGEPQKVHVIVVHHRGQDILRTCVETVLSSIGVDLRVVVVGNGGTEEIPVDVVDDPRVAVLQLARGVGFSKANNRGVAWARRNLGEPDYYYFLNNDTESAPEALSRLVQTLQERSGAAVVGPQLRIAWAREYLNSLGLNVTEDGWGWDEGIGQRITRHGEPMALRRVLAVTGSALLIRAAALHRVGGWTELYGYYFEDIDLCLKVWEAGLEVLHQPEAIVYHHVSATMTLESKRKVFLFWRNRLLLTMVHWPLARLVRVLTTVVCNQIWEPNQEAGRQLRFRALLAAAGRSPSAFLARWTRPGKETSWMEFLKPRGSIPPIRLPTATDQWAAPRAEVPSSGRVLVVGAAPLLMEQADRNFAAGARTWQLTKPILDAGYEVVLVGCRLPHTYPPETPAELVVADSDRFRYLSVAPEVFHREGFLARMVESFDPRAIVYAHASVSFVSKLVPSGPPSWLDVNGHVMTEAQAKAAVYRNDLFLDHFFRMVLDLMRCGDRYSSCCEPQTWAMVGELGLLGRLNSHNAGETLVFTIPVGVADEPYERRNRAFRGRDVPDDAFVVLWSGGYNTWTDVETMFAGLEWAMEREPSIHFVSTGGQIDGHDEVTYPDFVSRIESSRFKDRFILRGWIPREDVPDHYLDADVGLNCEKPIYEVVLGSKQRILDWSRAALPPVTSRLTELSQTVEREGVGWTFPPGDFKSLGATLVELARDRAQVRETGMKFRTRMRELYGYSATTAPLLEWLRDPTRASDRHRSTHGVEGLLWRQSILTRRILEYERRLRIGAEESAIGPDGLARVDVPVASSSSLGRRLRRWWRTPTRWR